MSAADRSAPAGPSRWPRRWRWSGPGAVASRPCPTIGPRRSGLRRRGVGRTVTMRARRRGRPAAVGHQPHQGERPDQALRHDEQHRHRVDAPQRRRSAVGVGQVVGGRLGARRTRRIEHADRADHRGHRAHDRREEQRRRDAPWPRRVAESPTRPSQLPAAVRSAGCPSPGRAAPAGTSRPPAGRWRSCCWRQPCRRGTGTRRRRRVSAPTPRANAAAAVSAEPTASTMRSPTRSTT